MTGVMFNINYQYLHDIFGRYLLADPGSAYLFVDDLFPIRIMIFILSRTPKYLPEIFHQFLPVVSPLSFVL